MQQLKPSLIQAQKQRLSPQMIQTLKLMTLPIQDLQARIQEELERNPALQVVEDNSSDYIHKETYKIRDENEIINDFANNDRSVSAKDDYNFNRLNESDRSAESDAKHSFIEGVLTRPESLIEHLLWQLNLQKLSTREMEIGELLINNLDDNGFHRDAPESLVQSGEQKSLEKILHLIQRFDPVGVCTENYVEAIKVQASLDPLRPDGTFEIIEKYFEGNNDKKLRELSRQIKSQNTETSEILRYISQLTPYPGRLYSNVAPHYIIPDLKISIDKGEIVCILNDEQIPVLGIDSYFAELSMEKKSDSKKDVETFVRSHISEAKYFIRSIHLRNSTLEKVAIKIIEFQRDFFLRGPKYLVPLTLKDIADEVGVVETTISRISNSKYVDTDWGIFPMKYFFTNSISGAGSSGSRYSKEGVKELIREILEDQQENNKLSDQKLADMLEKRGIKLARRTVAKYRKELDILSSYDR